MIIWATNGLYASMYRTPFDFQWMDDKVKDWYKCQLELERHIQKVFELKAVFKILEVSDHEK